MKNVTLVTLGAVHTHTHTHTDNILTNKIKNINNKKTTINLLL